MLSARRMAVEAGALAMAAIVDLQLSALHEARGEVALTFETARRCEEASRRWGLSTLPMAIVMQGFMHAQLGDRPAAEACIEAALATGEDRAHVQGRAEANIRGQYHVVAGDLSGAARCFDAAMDVLRANPGATYVFPGEWALLRTVLDDDGDAARAEVASLPIDTPVSRKVLRLADAVAAGRVGRTEEAEATFAAVDQGLATPAYAHHRAYLRQIVAPAAHADGWGDPIAWLRECLATFEASNHDALAARCRTLLKELGAPVPRKGRGDSSTVRPALAALGITSREADVLALVAGGATNREVAERLFISQRTVDKHVERLLQKAGTPRAGLADLARQAGLDLDA
jgi:DNA-binding CsgD family transcriptional regulator